MRPIRMRLPAICLLAFMVAACAGQFSIVQKDPVGASLYSMKTIYEGVVRSAGDAYLAGQLTEDQLRSIMVPARKFYTEYKTASELYAGNLLTDPEAKIEGLRRALDALQVRLQGLLLTKERT